MVYQANIPQPTDQLSDSQADILGNFQALEPIIDGIVSFPPQGTVPVIPLGTDALYAKVPAAPFPQTGVNELFVVKANGTSIPITASIQSPVDGWAYLPSGLLLKWGQKNAAAPGLNTFVFPVGVGIPAYTMTPFAWFFTPMRNSATPNAQIYLDAFVGGSNTNLQFSVYVTQNTTTTAATTNFLYFIIGI